MANDPLMSQEEIERLLNPSGGSAGTATAAPASPAAADADKLLGQAEIEKLLNEAARSSEPAPPPSVEPKEPPANPLPGEGNITPRDIEFLLNLAEEALKSVESGRAGDLPAGVRSFRLEEFSGNSPSAEAATLDLIRDVDLDLRIELGRTNMYLEDVLKLRKGAVVPLDKLAGDPVDIYVNDRLIARGEVLVLNDNFCVRVAELIVGASAFA
jgi:flagellar motor switch protein FliN/FliY